MLVPLYVGPIPSIKARLCVAARLVNIDQLVGMEERGPMLEAHINFELATEEITSSADGILAVINRQFGYLVILYHT